MQLQVLAYRRLVICDSHDLIVQLKHLIAIAHRWLLVAAILGGYDVFRSSGLDACVELVTKL